VRLDALTTASTGVGVAGGGDGINYVRDKLPEKEKD
jgi:hypothetical protein